MTDQDKEGNQDESRDSSIHVSSKYEDLVRSQMSQSKSALIDAEPNSINLTVIQPPPQSNRYNFAVFDQLDPLSLDGRRSPVGDGGGKKYEDSAALTMDQDRGQAFHINRDATFKKELVSIDSDTVRKTEQFVMGEAANVVVDDVLGNGHARTPVYSTKTPIYSRNGSAHSSTRRNPVVGETQDFARESLRSDSLEKRLLDSFLEDSESREKPPTPTYGSSKSGSVRATPQPEKIDDVLNPADRHSPIRRENLVGSPHVSDQGSKRGSEHGSRPGSTQGSQRGSELGSQPWSTQGSIRGSDHGSQRGSEHGSWSRSTQGSVRGSEHGSGHSSLRQTPQRDIINDTLRACQEKLYTGQDFRRSTERVNGSLSGGSSQGSWPQSPTSEQELTQYYELRNGVGGLTGSPGLPPVSASNSAQAQRTGSASSLPAVCTQRQSVDRRSMTPDNYIWVLVMGPTIKYSLLPSRGLQRVTPGSNTSSRTITQANAVADNQEVTQLKERHRPIDVGMSTPREVLKRQLTRSQPCMSTPGESLKRQLTRSQPLSGTTPREVLKRQVTRSHQVDVPIFIAFNLYMPYWEFQIEHAIRSINEAFSEFQQRHRPIDVGMSIPKEVLKRQLTRSLPFMSTPREALKKQLTRSQPCLSTPEESLKRQLTRSQISKIEGLARADLGTNRYSSIPFYQHQFIHELGHHQVDVPIFMAFNLYMPYWEFEIKHAIRSINEAVPGLHLYLTTDTYDYKIKITGEDEDDVYTEGNIILDREVIINLGRNFSDSEEQRRSTATHELMHALGVKHEHQRLDANQFVSYRRHSIHLSPRPHYYGLTAFDPMSIMMYSERDINRRGDAYIWMLKPCKDRELKMSELDKVGLNLLYKPAVNGSYNPRYNDKGLWNIYYCGRTFKQQDGTTGECGNITGGPTCPACRVLRCDALDSLVQNGKWQGWTGLVYCGRKFSNPSSDHDGYCGPNRGPQCPGCLFYPLSAYL